MFGFSKRAYNALCFPCVLCLKQRAIAKAERNEKGKEREMMETEVASAGGVAGESAGAGDVSPIVHLSRIEVPDDFETADDVTPDPSPVGDA